METFDVIIQQNLDSLLRIPFINSAITLGIGFYAYKAAPELPSFMEDLFNHVFFQIFVGFMMLYMSTRNVMLSFVVSIVFVYGVYLFAKVKENMFGGSDTFSEFMENQFEKILTKKLKQKGIATNVNMNQKQMQIQGLIVDTLKDKGFTPDDLGKWMFDDNGDLSTRVTNAINASSM